VITLELPLFEQRTAPTLQRKRHRRKSNSCRILLLNWAKLVDNSVQIILTVAGLDMPARVLQKNNIALQPTCSQDDARGFYRPLIGRGRVRGIAPK
jgi:hypothetical protein